MIITLSGITGVGKSYFKKCIIEELNFKNMAIVTTRTKRKDETNGVDKYFVTDEEFNHLKENKKILVDFDFLGNKYAYRTEDVFSNEDSVTELHYDTIYRFKNVNSEILSIYIIPKDINIAKEQLCKRNLNKQTEEMRIQEIQEQLNQFSQNKELQEQFNYIIYNDYTNQTKQKIFDIIQKNRKGDSYEKKSNCGKLEDE